MNLVAPVLVGQTAAFSMTYPVAATGNLYVFLWSSPPFAAVTPITVPGFQVHGVARVDPNNFVSTFSGLLGPSGTVSHSLAIPNSPPFLGYAWDLQSIDLAIASSDLSFADNELQLFISGNIPANMMPIAAGSFLMGSNGSPVSPYYSQAWERPVHQVTISLPFWMGKYEVTQAEYQALMNANPSYFQGASYPNSASRPVDTVLWADALAYCAALTASEATAGRLPAGYQYRLPTEAEWEYCCRAGATTQFSVGDTLGCAQANFYYQTGYCVPPGQTSVVGSYAANAWGLHDMHGNVWEWCLDRWDGGANYPVSPCVDPYVNVGSYRVHRGGGWQDVSSVCRSADRRADFPLNAHYYSGFRVVLAPLLF